LNSENKMSNLSEADEIICNSELLFSYRLLRPINLLSEQKRFFQDENYNPVFEYLQLPKELEATIVKLRKLELPNNAEGQLLDQKKKEVLKKLEMIQNLGDSEKFTQLATKSYGIPNKTTINSAELLIKEVANNLPSKTLSAEEGVQLLKQALEEYQIPNWNVEAIELVSSALVEHSTKTLYLDKDQKYSKDFIKRLTVHEIGTHILRRENGEQQKYKIFTLGLADYYPTEEGLAAYHELLSGLASRRDMRNYALRALAVNYALENSFSSTYKYLRSLGLGKKISFNLTLRVKRGLINTKEPGAFTKDHIYYTGFLKVKTFAENEGKLEDLYVGKIGVEHVEFLKQFEWLKKPKYYPKLKL
jgi:uncharacterized protein (TIGR02421 family)